MTFASVARRSRGMLRRKQALVASATLHVRSVSAHRCRQLEAILQKITINLAVNLSSLAFLAITGFVINILIGRYYGPSDLGVFNVVFALFIFFSQLGSFGLQYSTLRFASLKHDFDERHLIFRSAISLAVMTSSATVVLGFALTPVIYRLFDLGGTVWPWLIVLPGLWCFSLNKVLLAFLNGVEAMRSFAFFQSCRYIFMAVALLLFIDLGISGSLICIILTFAECALLPLLIFRLHVYFRKPAGDQSFIKKWRKQHFNFGAVAMPSGVMAELNTRVDTLIVAMMLGSHETGVYTIAILLAEGLGQVTPVVRNVINPMLAPIVEQRDQRALRNLTRRLGLTTAAVMAIGGVVLIALFPYLNRWYLNSAFSGAFQPLVILIVGQIITAPMMIFAMILNQGGKPALFTLFMMIVLVANVALNVAGTAWWGLSGAAIGTAISYLVGIAALHFLCARAFGLRLIS